MRRPRWSWSWGGRSAPSSRSPRSSCRRSSPSGRRSERSPGRTRRLANVLLGTTVRPPISSPGRAGFWRRGGNVLGDEAFWLQQVHLLQRFALGWALAVVELTLVAAGGAAIVEPIDYRWTNQDIGSWHVDSIGRALLFVAPGVLALVLAVVLIRPFGAVARSLVVGLLRSVAPADPASVAHTRSMRVRSVAIHVAVFVGLSAITTLVWALTSRGVLLAGLGHARVRRCRSRSTPGSSSWSCDLPSPRDSGSRAGSRSTRGSRSPSRCSSCASGLLTGHGYFWPVWPILVLLIIFGVHAAFVLGPAWRNGTLAERVAALETSRAGAVDQQDAELRRIERDLHDGAQARLVALGMSLGMAEQKLASDPDGARELLADARRGAHEALEELRDLARGIHPPVLADRGLEAAIAALASRTPLHVRVLVDVDDRPAPPVESAAYFVVAEALANTGKHAHAEHVDIAVRRRRDSMLVEIVDDGVGRRRSVGIRSQRPRAARRGARRDARDLEPDRRTDDGAGGDAVRVVIAEDLALLRDGLTRLLRDNGFDVVAAVTRRRRARPRGAARATGRRDRRHPAAADLPRRGPARRAHAARARTRDRGADRVAVRRADVRGGAARRRPRWRRLPAEGPDHGRRRLRRRRAPRRGRRHRARPRGRRAALRAPPDRGPARSPDAARDARCSS